jgi:hypothetical protein
MKRQALLCTIGLSLLGLTGCPSSNPLNGDEIINGTLHTGTITASETWTKAKGPHIIRGIVRVNGTQSAAKITIEPGAEVCFEGDAALEFGSESGTTGVLRPKEPRPNRSPLQAPPPPRGAGILSNSAMVQP